MRESGTGYQSKLASRNLLPIVLLVQKKPLALRILSKEHVRRSEGSTDKPDISVCFIGNSGLCICKYSVKLLFRKAKINHPHV